MLNQLICWFCIRISIRDGPMKNKAVRIGLIVILSICLIVAVFLLLLRQNVEVKTQVTDQFTGILEQSRENYRKDLFEILQNYGYQDFVKEIEDNNVNVIKAVVIGISTKDYQSLYKIMKEYGNTSVVRTLESIKRENSTEVFDFDDESEKCH
jgi:hypothetical protein